MSIKQLKGAIFDLDGVITQTATTHFKAWKTIFDDYLSQNQNQEKAVSYRSFSKHDYLTYVDGKPRYEGVMSFLDSRGIELPYGQHTEKPSQKTVCGLGNRKNQVFRELIDQQGVKIYSTSIAFIKQLRAEGIQTAVASSSKNSKYILEKTGLTDLFDALVGGIKAEEKQLKGKPNPDIFVEAAGEMGLHPSECLMAEDAIAGIQAGKNGNFSCVIAVARQDNEKDLLRFGGDFVIQDFKDLHWEDIVNWYEDKLYENQWHLRYHGFAQSEEKLRETLTTVGNGYFATRGCFENEQSYKDIHYPGTYLAGLFNKVPTMIHNKKIYNTDFVNAPNWLRLDFKIGDGTYLDVLKTKIHAYHHELDMKAAVMRRYIKFEDDFGHITTLESERFASMEDPHLALMRFSLTPHNYYDNITIRSYLDGTVINNGVERYRSLSSNHLDARDQKIKDGILFLQVQTNQSKVDIFMHGRHQLFQEGKPIKADSKTEQTLEAVMQKYSFDAKQNQRVTLEKIVSITSSRDQHLVNPCASGFQKAKEALTFDQEIEKHKKQWQRLWNIADIKIKGDRFAQKAVRLHTFHLLVTSSPHNQSLDVGIPARGLHGEGYRGHIFWDEMFVMPFYNLHFPEISRSALMYRYRRLDAAREDARRAGYQGAMYPWQSAGNGHEETQQIHFNPVSGKWDPDLSHLQRHVSLAIAVNILNYCRCTNDREFMAKYGAEMLIEITRFWASIATLNKDGRYHIRHVMGPDEFQEKYPGADKGGIHDNAYTNILVSWLLNKVIHLYKSFSENELKKIKQKTNIQHQETKQWAKIRDFLYVEFNPDGILAQFHGYFDLKELNWQQYRERYQDIRRMDRILKAENDSPNHYKVAKQADTLMLFYTLSPAQVKKILKQMGYDIGDEIQFLENNFRYYIQRTSHGSTLSYVVHAAILKYLPNGNQERSSWFQQALQSDILDTQGGTTKEGIHSGVMAGTLDILLESFAGLELFDHTFTINPSFPKHWKEVKFKIKHLNRIVQFVFTHQYVQISSLNKFDNQLNIRYKNQEKELQPLGSIKFNF